MNKYLGQHFLKNKSVIKKIVAALDLQPNDAVIEIGPGKGALTFPLAEECKKIGCSLVAIEKDEKLASSLELLAFSKNFKIEILKGDALKIIPEITKSSKLKVQSYKIVGNIPYYITGKLLRILGDQITIYRLPITAVVLMIQKEVAERIVAKPPQMNLLAAAVQFWAEPKILFTLKPGDFDPSPKVESAVIKLTTNNQQPTTKESENYYKLIKILFKQPRKTLFNNLKAGLKIPKNGIEAALKSIKINPNSRPQNLSLEQIKELARLIH